MVDTLVEGLHLTRGVNWLAGTVPTRWHQNRYIRSLLSDAYSVLSYVRDWQEAFCRAPSLNATLCNLNNLFEFRRCLRNVREYELIVVLHSAAGDSMAAIGRAMPLLQGRKGKLLVFYGNEYNLMPEKVGFAQGVGAEYIASQLPPASAKWLYSDCPSHVLHAPPGLNPELYRPGSDPRPIDVGFRGDAYRLTLGDVERSDLIRYFKDQAARFDLVTDIEFVRYHRARWTAFLNQCKWIVGAESGTYYLEKNDKTQLAVDEYLRQFPEASFEDIYTRFFKGYNSPVSGKAISSRHFEPIGTKTCQVLLEGQYNGILKADEHYVSVRKDWSNISEVVRKLKDREYREHMVNRTYDYVLAHHTYAHRVDTLLNAVL